MTCFYETTRTYGFVSLHISGVGNGYHKEHVMFKNPFTSIVMVACIVLAIALSLVVISTLPMADSDASVNVAPVASATANVVATATPVASSSAEELFCALTSCK